MKKRRIALLLSSLLSLHGSAATHQTPGSRATLPAFFYNSWVGLSAGIKKTPFSSGYIQSGLTFSAKKESIAALRLSVGHYFNPFFGGALSLMRGVFSNRYIGASINGRFIDNVDRGVSETLLGLTVLPTLPLGHGFSPYIETGAGLISRRGFFVEGSYKAISNDNILTALFGGGMTYRLPFQLSLNASVLYSLPVKSKLQPGVFFVAAGLNYRFIDHHQPRHYSKSCHFPLNFLQLAYVNERWFYYDVARYFTPPKSIPVFFDGHIKIRRGLHALFERTFFHTYKRFSLAWGASVGAWQTKDLKQNLLTLSVFPEMKWWIIRSTGFDFYFTYSLAGPTYISKTFLDARDSGGHFTFEDFLGFGAFIGRSKRLNINLKIVHFSNGNLLPNNPGLAVPVMLGIGVSF